MAVNGFTHEQVKSFAPARDATLQFLNWLKRTTPADGRPVFVSDTTTFDASFVYAYLWLYAHENPFGHSSFSIKDLYKGQQQDLRARHQKLRRTKHTHNALDDALGNADVFSRLLPSLTRKR
jgi:hypothetical protein